MIIRGLEQLNKRLDGMIAATAAHERLRPIADKVALRLQHRAVERAPVREGILRGSGKSAISQGAGGLVATISFGGMAEKYAEVQHEHTEFEHPKGGQAQYLYGGPDSAWNATQQEQTQTEIRDGLAAEIERAAEGH